MYERPVAETPAPERVPPAPSPRAPFAAALKLLLFQLLLGAVLVVAITLAARPLLDAVAVRALGLGTMFVVGFVDWRRWREIQGRWFPLWAALVYGIAFAVTYLLPD